MVKMRGKRIEVADVFIVVDRGRIMSNSELAIAFVRMQFTFVIVVIALDFFSLPLFLWN